MSETYIPLNVFLWLIVIVLAYSITPIGMAVYYYRKSKLARMEQSAIFESRAEVIRHRNELQKQLETERHQNRHNRDIIEAERIVVKRLRGLLGANENKSQNLL